jgi:hypothetical protein
MNKMNSGENAEEQPKKATGSAWIVYAFAATFSFRVPIQQWQKYQSM